MATIKANKSFDPVESANELIQAMKGFGTDEKKIIKVITSHSNDQRMTIKERYKLITAKDLESSLKSELRGKFEDGVLAFFTYTPLFLAETLKKNLKGDKTDESVIIEILLANSNTTISLIKQQFQQLTGKSLEDSIQSETTGYLTRLHLYQCQGRREESITVNQNQVKLDANLLATGDSSRFQGTVSLFMEMVCSRSLIHLSKVFEAFRQISGIEIEDAIIKETKDKHQEIYLALVKCIKSFPHFFSEKLHDSLKGVTNDNEDLIRIFVSRSEIDLELISETFQQMYGKSFPKTIKSKVRLDFQDLLLGVLNDSGN